MNNDITWCGNFLVKSNNEKLAEKLIFASNLLFSEDISLLTYVSNNCDLLFIENSKHENITANIETFLFFQDYQRYWKVFKNFDAVNFNLVIEDLFSRDTYLEFDKVDDKDKSLFFSDLLEYFNKNLFIENRPNKYKGFTKTLMLSYSFKEIFKNSKKSLIIPLEYQENILKHLSDETIFQYNWDGFKSIFNSIDSNLKNAYFTENSILEYFSPALNLAYSYVYKNNQLIYKNKKIIALVKNNFEKFYLKNIELFENMNIKEQKATFEIFLNCGRKELFEYMFKNFVKINKENYSEEEYEYLLKRGLKSPLKIDFDKYFLFKKLKNNFKPTYQEKKFKI